MPMADYSKIPSRTIRAFDRLVEDGVPTGGFLRAVCDNDLHESVCRADEDNFPAVADISEFTFSVLPYIGQGQKAWVKLHKDAREGNAVAIATRDLVIEMYRQRKADRGIP